MKIFWCSPDGDGWAAAQKLRDVGNKVVYFNPSENKNGLGYLPSVPEAVWKDYALKSDLIIVDSNFASRPTRRSFSPSDFVLDLTQIRRKGMVYIGPTPTSELFENDLRYQKKLLTRLGLNLAVDPKISGIRFTISRDPDRFCYLLFRHRHLLSDGNGPELGNLGDLVIPVSVESTLVKQTIKLVEPLLERLRFNGYFNLDVIVTQDSQLQVTGCSTRFLYPGVFAQLANLLSGRERSQLGLAVTMLRLDHDSDTVAEKVMNLPGFFGYEIHRDFDEGRGIVHGDFVGAVVGVGPDLVTVQDKVYTQLMAALPNGWGFRRNLGENARASLLHLNNLGLI